MLEKGPTHVTTTQQAQTQPFMFLFLPGFVCAGLTSLRLKEQEGQAFRRLRSPRVCYPSHRNCVPYLFPWVSPSFLHLSSSEHLAPTPASCSPSRQDLVIQAEG